MKKIILVLLLCLSPFLLSACTASSETGDPSLPAAAPLTVDLDLSRLSGTVVYSQVYNIMYAPDDYLGKVIKIAGYYSAFEDTTTGIIYHACVIPDAAACCAQGMEFVWRGEHSWPEDYPEEGTDIEVTGILASYEENGYEYLHLIDADVKQKQI